MYENFALLIDGREAFPEILRQVEQARETIRVNMFIWRDDQIGRTLAEALLRAARRGVQVSLSLDRYGMVLERCEESGRSLFHNNPTLVEAIKIWGLKRGYPANLIRPNGDGRALARALEEHPNVRMDKLRMKEDHSKFYLFDDRTLILGGINVEDKEGGADLSGRVYQDYMVRIQGKRYVEAFLSKWETGEDCLEEVVFRVNQKDCLPRRFELEEHYLELIRSARQELTITMAYFSPLEPFLREIVAAHRRGVRVSVLIPERANFQNDTNRKTVRRLMRETDNGISLYLSPKMVHTKLVMNEREISMGSTNITKKAFGQLNELNLVLKRAPEEPFVARLLESVRREQALSRPVRRWQEIRYHRLFALIEGILV